VCPLSVLHNWVEEFRRFAPGVSCFFSCITRMSSTSGAVRGGDRGGGEEGTPRHCVWYALARTKERGASGLPATAVFVSCGRTGVECLAVSGVSATRRPSSLAFPPLLLFLLLICRSLWVCVATLDFPDLFLM
jgi:hypothetical protein